MSQHVFELGLSEDVRALASKLVNAADDARKTLSCAESCTGGLVGGALTSVPGASKVFLGGVVSYAEQIKKSLLGVSEETLARYGAVSSQCASEMARGARRLCNADLAVSVTGIAGPGGAVRGKPVGTVWFGFASGSDIQTLCRHFEGDRSEVRLQSVAQALALLYEGLVSERVDPLAPRET